MSTIELKDLAGTKWYEIALNEGPKIETRPSLELAMDVYEETLSAFEDLMRKDSEQQWLRKVVKTGTHSDQVAALVTLAQMCPVLGMPHIKQLVNLCQVKATRIAEQAMTALKRLLVEDLVPSRKLVSFIETIATSPPMYKQGLLIAYFEDFMKKTIATFVQLLFDSQTSPIESTRNACVEYSYDLLACIKGAHCSGEQEKPLLKLLIKALSDKAQRRVSAKAALMIRKLAKLRPHLKETIIDEIRDQHLLIAKMPSMKKKSTQMDFDRGMSLSCSLLSVFPLDPQDDVFVATKLVTILSELVNRLIAKKDARDKKHALPSNAGITENEARILRLCLQALEKAFSVAGSDCPVPETTNSLLIRLCHETTIPGLSISILNFLHRLSIELKTDSPKLLRALYGQIGSIPTYTSNQLPYLLSLVKESVIDNNVTAASFEPCRIAFKRRLIQVAASVAEPVLPVILALVQPADLEARLAEINEDLVVDSKFGYNPSFFDPSKTEAETEPRLWERELIKHHFVESVRAAADAQIVAAPEEPPSLSAMLVNVSALQQEKRKRKREIDTDDMHLDDLMI
jgi:hypothetical protein